MQPLVFHPVNTISQGQVGQAQNTYNQDVAGASGAQRNLQNYQQNMQGGTQMYGEQLGKAEQSLGFNPQELANAQRALATTQTTMANLPQAVQQQGGGYGVTAGAEANNMAQMGGNLQALLQGQTNQVGALGNIYQSTLGQAQAATQAGQQGQQLQLGALENLYQNASDQMKTAQTQLLSLTQLYQQQGQFNASQQAEYEKANAAMLGAQAAMRAAQGQYAQNMAQAQQLNLQNAVLQQRQGYQMNPNGSGGFNFFGPGQRPITVQQYNAEMGTKIDPATGQPAGGAPAPTQQAKPSSGSFLGNLFGSIQGMAPRYF